MIGQKLDQSQCLHFLKVRRHIQKTSQFQHFCLDLNQPFMYIPRFSPSPIGRSPSLHPGLSLAAVPGWAPANATSQRLPQGDGGETNRETPKRCSAKSFDGDVQTCKPFVSPEALKSGVQWFDTLQSWASGSGASCTGGGAVVWRLAKLENPLTSAYQYVSRYALVDNMIAQTFQP